MALTLTAGNIASGTNTGTVAVSYPVPGGGILAGDFLFLHIPIHKATQAGTEAPATPSGWTPLVNLEGGANVAAGADAGLCRIYTFYTTAAGGETGSLNVTINNNVTGTSGSCAGGVMWHVHADSGSVDIAGATGDDATGGTGLSVTFSSNPGLQAGDLCLVTQATPTDTIPSGLTGTDITATGATFNAIVNGNSAGSALGLDGGIYRFAQTVATGPGSAAPVWAGTLGGTTTNWYGPAALIRIRETTAAATVDANQYRPPAGWGLLWPNVEASLQLMGDRSTEQFPALDDTGSGSDVLTVAAAVPLAETGTGVDALSAVAAAPLAETGTAGDALAVAVTTSLSETATGADALTVTVTVSLAETGTGTDAATVGAAVPLAETGTAADSLSVLIDAPADPYQAGPQIAWMFLNPNAASIQLQGDSTPIVTVSLSETGTGVDSATVTAAAPLAETGAGVDALTAAASVPLAETGTGVDAATISAATALAETGVGVDALTSTAAVPLAETGVGTDALTVSVTLTLSDTGTGTDALTAGVPITLTETGAGTDALTATATVPLAETATATDALSVSVSLALSDTGSAVDAMVAGVPITFTETATGSDALTVAVAAPRAETATATDVLSVSAALALAETGTAVDTMTIVRTVALTETGTATDAMTIAVSVTLTETGVAVDVLTLPPIGSAITRVSTGSRRQRVSTGLNRQRVSTGNSRQRITTELG